MSANGCEICVETVGSETPKDLRDNVKVKISVVMKMNTRPIVREAVRRFRLLTVIHYHRNAYAVQMALVSGAAAAAVTLRVAVDTIEVPLVPHTQNLSA